MKTDEQKGTYNAEVAKVENAALRRYAALQKSFEEVIGCQKVYVDIAGGIVEAFIIDELVFFTLPRAETGRSGLRVRKNGYLWMAVSRTEWWDRKRITPKQADGAIERLVKNGLVIKDMFLFNKQKTTHLRLNVPEFFKRYTEILNEHNPPEDDGDTLTKDIQDLYEMLGIPKRDTPEGIPEGDTGIPFEDTASLNGDSINSPDASLTQPLKTGDKSPIVPELSSMSIENQIYAGVQKVIVSDDTQARRVDAANLIATGFGANSAAAFGLVMAFQNERNITFTQSDIKGQRKAVRELLEKKVKPNHIKDAIKKLVSDGMTFVDMYGVRKTAIDFASKVQNTITALTTDEHGIPESY